jgi:RNA polymerase sigma factor (sigma-70 family)
MELVRPPEARASRLENDEWLWSRSLAGDGRAFGGLFDRYRNAVFRHACRLAGTRQDAEDLVASAFLELWRRRSKVQLVDGSVLPWLLVTTTNLGRNFARAQRRHRHFLGRLPRVEDHPDTAEIAFGGHGLGVDNRLRAGLLALRKMDAQLFALVALEGYPVGAAAGLLGLSESAARTRLHRVRASLRAQLGGDAVTKKPGIQGVEQ